MRVLLNSLRGLLIAVVCVSLSAQAAKGGGESQGDNNGKPFQELNQIISENRSLIEANEQNIADLQVETAAINNAISTLQVDLALLAGRVSANEDNISDLQVRTDDLADDVIDLLDALARLRADHDADVADLQQQMADARLEISSLRADLTDLATRLSGELAALQIQVDNNDLAIDGLLIDLASTNSQVALNLAAIDSLESSLAGLEQQITGNADAIISLQLQLDAMDTRITTNEADIDVLQGFHTRNFSGILTNQPKSSMNGWEVCYSDTYGNDNTSLPEDIQANCTKANIMLACAPVGSVNYDVAANGARNDVFREMGRDRNASHVANGVSWYFSENYSMGFHEPGDGVSRTSCDTATGAHPEKRLCWHTHDSFGGGWRCGTSRSLNRDNGWERFVLQAD